MRPIMIYEGMTLHLSMLICSDNS